MVSNKISNAYEYGSQENKAPRSLVILLHGVGSNGQDLISLAPILAQGLPDTLFISPDAPFECDMVPAGYPNAYQWFSLQDRDPHVMRAGVEACAPIVDAFIDAQLEKYGVRADKLALLGFSQGTMMSLHVGPRYKDKIAGVLGYSGALCGAVEGHAIPVHLVHGEADDVVPLAAYEHARGALIGAGHQVSGHTTAGLAHSIDEAGIKSGAGFLRRILY